MTRLHVLVALLLGVTAVAGIFFFASREPAAGDSPGATVDLVEKAALPIEWTGNDTVTFELWNGSTSGRTTVRLDGTVVSTTRQDNRTAGPAGTTLEPETRLGSWRAWDGGRYLVRGDEKCGPPLLPSPDGRFIACVHTITHRMRETSDAYGAVVRVR